MRQRIYLTVTKSGVKAMTKREPTLRGGEFALCVWVEVPDHFFKQSIPVVDLRVPDNAVVTPSFVVDLEDGMQAGHLPLEPGGEWTDFNPAQADADMADEG